MYQHVDIGNTGSQDGSRTRPWSHPFQAIVNLFQRTGSSHKVLVRGGYYDKTGARGHQSGQLKLDRVVAGRIDIKGVKDDWRTPADEGEVVFDFKGSPMCYFTGGDWSMHDIQFGRYSRPTKSQNAVFVAGSGTKLDIWRGVFQTGSLSGTVWADRHGLIRLMEDTLINEDMHQDGTKHGMRYSHAGISATDGGRVMCGRKVGRLSMGSGSCSASMGGSIELGWPDVYLTSHQRQANNLAINDRGAMHWRGSKIYLNATHDSNAVIGFEGEGYGLHENALTIIDCTVNNQSVAMQKASKLLGGKRGIHPGNMLIRGDKGVYISATTGSMMELVLAFEDGGRVSNFMVDAGAQLHVSGDIPAGYRFSKRNGGRMWINRVEI